MRTYFIDLDGVLADFDGHFEAIFGVRPIADIYSPRGMFDKIKERKTFFSDMPIIPGAYDFWDWLEREDFNPVVLTGYPKNNPGASDHKKLWVRNHLGAHVPVICCLSEDKRLHGRPQDVLVDDRLKYSQLWVNMGGVFVHHRGDYEITKDILRSVRS